MASEETQIGVATKMDQAMQDLALKGERQRAQKAKEEQEAASKQEIEDLEAPRKERLARQRDAEAMYGSANMQEGAAEQEEEDIMLDDEAELDSLRHLRTEQIKKQRDTYIENKSKGHGEYTEIFEDQFLDTVIKSKFCVVHFYHDEFERSKILDMHLGRLAPNHVESRFVKINAEKAKFFTEKLGVRTLPTVVFFEDGKATDRMEGLEGLGGDDFKTRVLEERIGLTGAIKMERAFYEDAMEAKIGADGGVKGGTSNRAKEAFEDEFSSDEDDLWN